MVVGFLKMAFKKMWMNGSKIMGLLGLLFVLNACSSAVKEEYSTADFPRPYELQTNIEFWHNVYSQWDLNEFIFHDNRYLSVVYQKKRYQNGIYEVRTDFERAAAKTDFEQLKTQLNQIESKLTNGLALSQNERDLVAPLMKIGGVDAIIGASDRLRVQRGLKIRFKKGVETSYAYLPYFKEIFRRKGLPVQLAYLPHVESSFQENARSSVGATGMWQFMRTTAREYMIMTNDIDGRLDPIISAEGAANYLQDSYNVLGYWPYALTAYNHGTGGMQRAQAIYGQDFGRMVYHYNGARFGFASRNFYAEYLAAIQIAQNVQHYFPSHNQSYDLNKEGIVLLNTTSAAMLAGHFKLALSDLERLNPAWKNGALAGELELPSGLLVWLPKHTLQKHPHASEVGAVFSYNAYLPNLKK